MREPFLVEQHRDALKVILRSDEDLLVLINDVLDFANIEARKIELVPADAVYNERAGGLSDGFETQRHA
ncbi:hypothetical protein AYM40_07135 [Paraburkholderia phytofirmans OLGA172]|uniref:Uncharacterized protein n=2 Tax=Paraburkholderia phytofirmans TaxID=261302 RepID=A0A160FJ41_9BURK|nr:hypothetical protein AYM40_07135 [Paraburkholderia phytofirmans OLGA172]